MNTAGLVACTTGAAPGRQIQHDIGGGGGRKALPQEGGAPCFENHPTLDTQRLGKQDLSTKSSPIVPKQASPGDWGLSNPGLLGAFVCKTGATPVPSVVGMPQRNFQNCMFLSLSGVDCSLPLPSLQDSLSAWRLSGQVLCACSMLDSRAEQVSLVDGFLPQSQEE